MKHTHRLSNPLLNFNEVFGIPMDDAQHEVMNENGTLYKTLLCMILVGVSAFFTWKISPHIVPEMIVVLFLCSAIIAFFSMVFPIMSSVMAPVFSVLVGMSLGAMGALVMRELSGSMVGGAISSMVNVSVVVSVMTLSVMLLLRRYYVLSTINKTNIVIIGAMIGFFAAFALMRVLGRVMNEMPFFYDTMYGFNIIFGAMVALFMAISTVHHLKMVRINCHKKFPKYMEWYMALGVTFSLVWFYNECLNLMLGAPANDTDYTETKSK